MFDTHLHTKPFSTDSSMTFEQMLKRKEELGINVVLTEHMDIDFGGPEDYYFEPKEYFDTYLPYRDDSLLLGVEVGMQTQVVAENIEFVTSHPFDMVIGSVHAVNGLDIYEQEFFEAFADKREAYMIYLHTAIENLKTFECFDTFGHLDYVCRQAPYADTELDYMEYADEIDTILRLLVEKGKAMELNTRRIGNPKSVEALIPIYQRYYEFGGRCITVGSDSHDASAIGTHFNIALEMAEKCQLRPVYFKERKANYWR